MTEPLDITNDNQSRAQLVEILATQNVLLVAIDFDGTIAGFSDNPSCAVLEPGAREALRVLSDLANTHVVVVSGRSVSDLMCKFPALDKVRLIGSHGHEYDSGQGGTLTQAQSDALSAAHALLIEASSKWPGSSVEIKSHAVAFHFRAAQEKPLEIDLEELRNALAGLGSGIVRDGSMVLEYCSVRTNKGDAVQRLRNELYPSMIMVMGDDRTDEDAFHALPPSDRSVKVGSGETDALFRVRDVVAAVTLLSDIAARRREWMGSLPTFAIDQHIFLSDMRTAALIDQAGSVNWLCTPRIDSSPLFGAIVGGPSAGYFRLAGLKPTHQSYCGDSLVAQTAFTNCIVTDLLDCSAGRAFQRAGRSDLVRIIEGGGEITAELAPKFNFGRVPTRITNSPEGLRIDCGQEKLAVVSPGWNWEIIREGRHDVARCRRTLDTRGAWIALLLGTSATTTTITAAQTMRQNTQSFWDAWSATLRLPMQHVELVRRSALILRGLCFGPSGAFAAAATTSIPEALGRDRNWDYRFCWPRDGSYTAQALLRLGVAGPAMKFLDWILEVTLDSTSDRFLSPLYTVSGRSVIGEAEIPDAIGYRGSRPVRIGNLAANQLQLDVLGPISQLMAELSRRGGLLTAEHLQLCERFVELVQLRWMDPDSGIWEIRGEPRNFVHSKLMCWATINNCARVARFLGNERQDWDELASSIRADIEHNGFDTTLNSYVAAYDLPEADAALLWVVLSGFHPPDHPRSLGTLRFIYERLYENGLMYRYRYDDSLAGKEGEFIICRCWLIEAFAMAGCHREANSLLNELISRIGPTGLISEQWDEHQGGSLGNYPQAYSHLGLINAVCAVSGM